MLHTFQTRPPTIQICTGKLPLWPLLHWSDTLHTSINHLHNNNYLTRMNIMGKCELMLITNFTSTLLAWSKIIGFEKMIFWEITHWHHVNSTSTAGQSWHWHRHWRRRRLTKKPFDAKSEEEGSLAVYGAWMSLIRPQRWNNHMWSIHWRVCHN